MILDGDGLIASITNEGTIDGGDSLSETGKIYFLMGLMTYLGLELPAIHANLQDFKVAIMKLFIIDVQWIRSPTHWRDPFDVSRDQLLPMNCALAIHGQGYFLKKNRQALIKNFFRFPNGDLCSPEHYNHFGRYWLRYLGDCFMLLNSIIIVVTSFFDKQGEYVRNDLNALISMLHAEFFSPTFISRWAAVIYFAYRRNGWRWALEKYYTVESGNRDLIEFYEKPIKWLMERC